MKQPTTRRIKVNGNEKEVVTQAARPLLLNGETIYYYKDDTTNIRLSQDYYDSAAVAYIQITNELRKATEQARMQLPDGKYQLEISNIIVDKNGQIVYFETGLLKKYVGGNNIVSQYSETNVPEIPASIIRKIVEKTLPDAKYIPLIINDTLTPYLFNLNFLFDQEWGVKDVNHTYFFRRHIK